ncbi:hypothetical protein [uncultured Hoeflea sp.]|uniref:hypothetical protein n=1 Tax=uncultured Hoeflea sp. TaxID=538666 RepID=UPI0030EF0D0E
MVFDDIIIGSGLSALAVAIGLPRGRRILVLAGPAEGRLIEYPQARGVPCQYLGHGGLGNYWHGVIPFLGDQSVESSSREDFKALLAEFYPAAAADLSVTEPALFIPRAPIRPQPHWAGLQQSRNLTLTPGSASLITLQDNGAVVEAEGERHEGRRVWCCAGALETPRLLARSLGEAMATGFVSDHVIVSLGLAPRTQEIVPNVRRGGDGYWLKPMTCPERDILMTARPARFSFARLDSGIERRAVFGLPTRSILGRLMKAPDPGLISEALFNKFGLFPQAAAYNIYAQLRVRDAYALDVANAHFTVRQEAILEATDNARQIAAKSLPGMQPSRRRELYIPGIHLHRTVDKQAALSAGILSETSPLQIADASILDDIGGAHHSFGMMLSAWKRARNTG